MKIMIRLKSCRKMKEFFFAAIDKVSISICENECGDCTRFGNIRSFMSHRWICADATSNVYVSVDMVAQTKRMQTFQRVSTLYLYELFPIAFIFALLLLLDEHTAEFKTILVLWRQEYLA